MKYPANLTFFCLLLVCFFSTPIAHAQSAKLFFNDVPRQVEAGKRFTLGVRVDSGNQPINAVSGVVSFPESLVRVVSISKEKSILNLWISEPAVSRSKIAFEGVILNPGFTGSSGSLFYITFEGKNSGKAALNFTEGAILANDGQGSNILGSLGSASLLLVPASHDPREQGPDPAPNKVFSEAKSKALPVITNYSASVEPETSAYVRGVGEPGALTRLVFSDISLKSAGEKFINFLQAKKVRLEDVLVRNNKDGRFLYVNASSLMAGTYNVMPFLVDDKEKEEKQGVGVELLVKENPIVSMLVVSINVLVLLIPIVGLLVIIYFIPWYSWRRMRVLKKKLGLEEEKIVVSGRELEREEKMLDQNSGKMTGGGEASPSL